MEDIKRYPLRRLEREKANVNVTKRLKSSEEVENEKPAVQRHPSLSIGDNQSKQKLVVNLTSNVASNDTSDDQVVKRQSHSHRLKDKENIGDDVLHVPTGVSRPNKRKSGSFSYLDIPIPRRLSTSSRSYSLRNLHSPLKAQIPPEVRNVDSAEANQDPLHCTDIANDIVSYMRELEKRRQIKPSTKNPHIKLHMRAILIDWLTQVEHHVKLSAGTFYLAVNMIDRYVETEPIDTDRYQLLGVTAMFVASKMEERYAIQISELTYLTDNTYSYEDVIEMEKTLVKVLRFNLYTAEPYFFLRRDLQCAGLSQNKTIHDLSTYLLDVIITDAVWLEQLPSHLAAAALCLAQQMVNEGQSCWDRTIEFYSGYTAEELMPTMSFMAYCMQISGTGRLVGAFNKYQSRSKDRIASNTELTSTNSTLLSFSKRNTRVKTME